MTEQELSDALDAVANATKHAEDTGNEALATELGEAYQVLGDEALGSQHNINESHDKIRLETDLTRGTGTRDQEKHKLKVRGETAAEAAARLSTVLGELKERNVFERAREVENDE